MPLRMAREVALYAQKQVSGDKQGRRKIYENMGMPLDESVL